MGWQLSVVSLLGLASSAVALLVGALAVRERPDPMAWPIALLFFTIVLWAVPDAISAGFTDPDRVVRWAKFSQLGAVSAPVFYLLVAVKYAGYEQWLSRGRYVALGVVPVLTLPLAVSYPAYSLYWVGHEVQTVQGASLLITENGPGGWLVLGYAYLATIAGLFLLASVAVRAGPIHRRESSLMFAAGIVPFAANAASTLGVGPAAELDPTTPALTVSGLAFATVVFRDDFLNLSPAAYQNVPDIFGDGVLVFGAERRLIEANSHAERILAHPLDQGTASGEIFDVPLEDLDGTIVESTDTMGSFYNLRYSPLSNYRGTVVGHAVVMRDVTDLKEHEQRLSVTNRILRHNLRNELNVILGRVSVVEQRLDDASDADGDIEGIEEAATRLLEVGEKARNIQASMRIDDGRSVPVDAVALVESIVREHHAADVSLDTPERALVAASSEDALGTVIENVVENAIQHSDRDRPVVDVTVRFEGGDVVVRVADDGPGIPEAEREILDERVETDLEHGSGIGLWLVYWLTSAMDGEVAFADNEPRGTIVTLRFPAASESAAEATGEATTGQEATD